MTTDPPGTEPAPSRLNPEVPHSARVWNYWLGGKDNFAADRELGYQITQFFPDIVDIARQSRQFLSRAVRYLAGEEGVRQFLDIGTGLPTADNTHEVAQRIAPAARIVYVDNDPIVLVHARALLTSDPAGRVQYIAADLRKPHGILKDPALRDTLDLRQPVGLTLVAVLMLLADADDPWAQVEQLCDALPSGSCLAITHPTADFNPDEVNAAVAAATGAGMTLVARPRDAVERFFGDWELLEPGMVPVSAWQPAEPVDNPEAAYYWAGVARKP